MRYSIIDIGTNTILLLIAESTPDSIFPLTLLDKIEIPRIGKDVDKNRNILPESIRKASKILNEYKELSDEYGSEIIIATATSFIRDSNNKDEFLKKIKEKTDIDVEILSGKDEAKWSLWGSIFDKIYNNNHKNVCVIDIGGGSTEISMISIDTNVQLSELIHRSLPESVSIDIGSVRINEKFTENGILNKEKASGFIIKAFDKVIKSDISNSLLIGAAGTVTTLSAYHNKLTVFDPAKVDNSILTIEDINTHFEHMRKTSPQELLKAGSYMKGREDIIASGVLILKLFMDKYIFKKLTVTTKGLRYGIYLRENLKE